jgi:hypothetical protein
MSTTRLRRRNMKPTKTVELPKYSGRDGRGTFRQMTLDEVLSTPAGSIIWCRTLEGDARLARVKGKVKVWKRMPGRFEISLKYGRGKTFRLSNLSLDRLLVEVVDE